MKRLALLLAVVAMACLLGGCLINPSYFPWWNPPGGATETTPYVLVFGDSLTVQTQWDGGARTQHVLTDHLQASGYASIVDAFIGATTNDLVGLDQPTHDPDVLIIALGSNDAAANYVPVDQTVANITGTIDASPATCVWLVNINTVSWDFPTTAPPYNAAYQTIADNSGGKVHVADWNSLVLAHPEYVYPDNPHTTAVGTNAYRTLIEQSIAACGGPS